jgi:hypothetical protein
MASTKKHSKITMVRVIRDCRNADKDYHLPKDSAKKLYDEGKLHWDMTNGCYCTPLDTDSKIGLE